MCRKTEPCQTSIGLYSIFSVNKLGFKRGDLSIFGFYSDKKKIQLRTSKSNQELKIEVTYNDVLILQVIRPPFVICMKQKLELKNSRT